MIGRTTHLDSLLEIFDVIPINVVVGSNGLFQFWANDHAWALSARATGEDHNAPTGILERSFKQPNSNADSDAGAPQRSLVIGDRPWVALQLFEDVRNLKLGLLHWQKEASRGALRTALDLGTTGSQAWSKEPQHLLHLLGRVILVSSKDIRLGALAIPQLVNLGLHMGSQRLNCTVIQRADEYIPLSHK